MLSLSSSNFDEEVIRMKDIKSCFDDVKTKNKKNKMKKKKEVKGKERTRRRITLTVQRHKKHYWVEISIINKNKDASVLFIEALVFSVDAMKINLKLGSFSFNSIRSFNSFNSFIHPLIPLDSSQFLHVIHVSKDKKLNFSMQNWDSYLSKNGNFIYENGNFTNTNGNFADENGNFIYVNKSFTYENELWDWFCLKSIWESMVMMKISKWIKGW